MKTPLSKLTRALKKITGANQIRVISSAPFATPNGIQVSVIAMDFKNPGPAELKYTTLKNQLAQIMPTVYPESIQSDRICHWDINGGWASYLKKSLYTTYTLTLFTDL